ncbi:MAG TPA: hypothetical protein VGD60_11815 [Candidatus Acidoferrales bacterium]
MKSAKARPRTTKNGRKPQSTAAAAADPPNFFRDLRSQVAGLTGTPSEIEKRAADLTTNFRLEHQLAQAAALAAQTQARQSLISSAEKLLVLAEKQAERGRPRLLAVLSKIILDRNLRFRVEE